MPGISSALAGHLDLDHDRPFQLRVDVLVIHTWDLDLPGEKIRLFFPQIFSRAAWRRAFFKVELWKKGGSGQALFQAQRTA